jgi:hypothetical protein
MPPSHPLPGVIVKRLANLLAALAVLCIPALAHAGEFDGIYQVSGDSGYVVLYQTGTMLIVVDLAPTATDGTNITGTWNRTTVGTIVGRTATMQISDHVHVQTSIWTFNSDGSVTVTTPSCQPATGYTGDDACDMLGRTVTINKLL